MNSARVLTIFLVLLVLFVIPVGEVLAEEDSCPVTLPNGRTPPGERPSPTQHGNSTDTIWTGLWPEGTVIFRPNGPGEIRSDGSLAMKWWWWETVTGHSLSIEGRRLDAPAPPMYGTFPSGVTPGPFQPSTLVFPTTGCWEVTGRAGDASLTFVTRVVRVLRRLRPTWLPTGLIYQSVDRTSAPESIRTIFDSSGARGAGRLTVEATRDVEGTLNPYPQATQQTVTVRGRPGTCAQVGWDKHGRWRSDPDAGGLVWTARGIGYRIIQVGLGLSCQDLLRIAGSLP